ncbi:unnamed protein product [Arctia plantaginis]|uniref:Reverse transcriptase n=1 Tax=Arctia plantaginis TaxID=874455 RepID=A0A8S0YQV7_ARCPL|nr:unnamed protein product [Arctia plantaginis]
MVFIHVIVIPYGIKINWKSARLICQEIEYFGHLVKDGQEPSPEKVEAVALCPEPMNSKQVQSFIGLTLYYRKNIKDYAQIVRPLINLMKKDA